MDRKLCGFIQHPHVHACAMQAGSRCIVARWAGGLEWRGSCFGAGAGWGRQPCLRPTVHPVRGRVRRDGTKWTPLANLQQATVNRTRGGSHSSPYCFSRNTCAVSVAEESTTVRPGQDNEARMGTGHVRPSRPPPSLPSLRCPAAGSHLSRNASRVGRDCETPMRIDPQGPHSSTAIPDLSRPKKGCCLLSSSTAEAPRPHWSGDLASTHPPHVERQNLPCSCASPRDGGGGTALAGRRRVDNSFARHLLQQQRSAQQERGREGRPSTLDRVPVIGSRSHSVPRSHGDGALLGAAPGRGRYSRSIGPSGPSTAVVLHARAGIRRPRRDGDRQIEHCKVVYFVLVAASLAIIAVTRVIDDEIRGPVDITSVYCLNTVPGNCLDCVAESQTGSGERRRKHQPNCNAFDFLGGHESNRHTRHCLSALLRLAGPVTQASGGLLPLLLRHAAPSERSCLSVSVRCREFANVSPKTKGEGPANQLDQARREQHLVSAPAATIHPPAHRLPLINATRLLPGQDLVNNPKHLSRL